MKPPARNKVLLGAFRLGQVSDAMQTRFSMGIAKLFISTHLLICLLGLLGSVSWAGDDNATGSGMVLNAAQTPALFPKELTGNWGGLRAQLLERGVSLGLESTHFYQGSVSGDRNQDFDWGGRVDVFLNLDAAKLGLWEGGRIITHGELKYGQLLANRGGAFLPGNTGMMLPVADLEEFVFSSIYLTQQFGDKATLMLGKINAVDLLAGDAFLGDWGNTRFMNLAFAAPLTGVTPPVLMGGILSVRTDPFTFTFMVYDTEDRTLDYLPGDLFGNGVTFQLGAKWNGSMLGR
jgi:porin